jgi:hypothetical protein
MRSMVARLMPNWIVAHQRFARQFEEDSFVGWFGHEWGS